MNPHESISEHDMKSKKTCFSYSMTICVFDDILTPKSHSHDSQTHPNHTSPSNSILQEKINFSTRKKIVDVPLLVQDMIGGVMVGSAFLVTNSNNFFTNVVGSFHSGVCDGEPSSSVVFIIIFTL